MREFSALGCAGRPCRARGMTLLEVAVATAVFALVLLVAYAALQSMRTFTRTNMTQVELQEEARHALEFMTEQLQCAGRLTEPANPQDRTYPKRYRCANGYPNGYANANQHPPKNNPKAKPGSNANGGDPSLDSDEIIFKRPQSGADGRPLINGNSIVWTAEEYGFFLVPQPDGTNSVELRSSAESQQQLDNSQPVQGRIVARFVDRMQIQDMAVDPTLTSRQLRITLYLTRQLDALNADAYIIVALSTIVDMRNTSQLE